MKIHDLPQGLHFQHRLKLVSVLSFSLKKEKKLVTVYPVIEIPTGCKSLDCCIQSDKASCYAKRHHDVTERQILKFWTFCCLLIDLALAVYHKFMLALSWSWIWHIITVNSVTSLFFGT